MHANEQLVEKFYTNFQTRDAAGMCACYHPQVIFSDPVFDSLRAAEASAMWHMLCARARDLEITFSNIRADDHTGAAHWEARYTFSKSGRRVHNVIAAAFVFREGLMLEHHDSFSLWKWARMALGPAGALFGWTPFLRQTIRKEARSNLNAFVKKQSA